MKNPFISIILLNYNGEKFLEPCINSILNSTYKSFELIIYDNNSSDNSLNLLKKYIKNKKIKIIKSNQNHGFSKGNNLAALYAEGSHLFFLSNDT